MTLRFPGIAHYRLNDALRNCDFTVAICFGDRDFLGSEGADDFIRESKYFESGKSGLDPGN